MKVLTSAVHEILHHHLWIKGALWILPLHNGGEFLDDFRLLIFGEQVGNDTRGENVVQVLQEALLLDV